MSATRASSIERDDVRAAVAANGELGGDYEDALTSSLLDRLDAHVEQRTSQRATAIAHDAVTVLIALGSVGLGVVFVAAADPLGAVGGTLATIVAWIAIVAVNIAHARARRP